MADTTYTISLTDDVSKTAMVIESHLYDVADAAAAIGKKAPAATDALKGISTAGVAAGVVLGELATKAFELSIEMGEKLADGLIEVGKYLYETADLASRARLSLANMFGSQAKGNAVLDDAVGLARRFGLSLDQTIERVQQFAGLGFSRAKIGAMFELGADFKALGRSEDQINRIFADLEHMQASGFLDGRVVRSLAMNGVSVSGVYLRIAHNMRLAGTEQEKIAKVADLVHKKQIRAGAATNAIAESILIRGHKSELGELGEQAADETLGGLVSKMQTGISADIFDAVRNAEPALVEGMQSIFDGFSEIDKGGLQNTLLDALFAISDFLDKVGPELPEIADNFVKAFSAAAGIDGINLDNLAEQLPAIATQLGTIAGNLAKIAEAAAKFATGTFSGNSYTGSPISLGKGLGATPGSAFERFADEPVPDLLKDAGRAIVDFGKDAADRAAEAGGSVGAGLVQGISDSAPTVGAAAADAAQGAVDASKDTLQIHSPSAVMADQGNMLADGLALGIDEHAGTAFSSASALAQGAIDASGGKLGLTSASSEAAAVGSAAGASAAAKVGGAGPMQISLAPTFNVDGSKSPQDTVHQIHAYLETELAVLFERHLEAVGA